MCPAWRRTRSRRSDRFSFVVEWNGAVRHATFVDDLGNDIRIVPAAWQVSLAYQFDWNPTVQVVGEQGTYFAVGYSESQDLAGATRVIDGVNTRVGFVPEKRFLVGVGEWVLDGVRIAVEYSHVVDYSASRGRHRQFGRRLFRDAHPCMVAGRREQVYKTVISSCKHSNEFDTVKVKPIL